MQKIIEINNVTKNFKNKAILNSFSEVIYKNELIAIVGESGKGKTTLINMIGGLDKIDSGEVIIDGVKIDKKNMNKFYQSKISFLFQNFALVDEWTVQKNLELAFKFKKIKDKKAEITRVLKLLNLEDNASSKIHSLSGGEQQRVSLARLIIQDNDIILADEPTGSLDEKNRDIVFDILLTLKNQGKTIVIVTHDKFIANKCDRIISL
ncbi:MAG: ABC transporter ATP-binding protein [Mycoplasmatales bacterium]